MSAVYVALDLEMTGQDYERDDIIQIGAVKFDERRVIGRWQSMIRPRASIPFRITRLTGISASDVRTAPTFEHVRADLDRFLADSALVGHSVSNDVRFLASKGLALGNQQYDTWELATLLLPSLSAYNLHGVARALDVAVADAHNALADAEASMGVFRALLGYLRRMPADVLGEVVQLMAGSDWELLPLFRALHSEALKSSLDRPKSGSIAERLLARGLTEDAVAQMLLAPPAPEPALRRMEPPQPLDVSRLRSLFAPDGPLAHSFSNYELRPQQVRMMEAVAGAFNDSRVLVAEAGTGTGKSLAYLLPAAQWALSNQDRVVISTDTINLQDQLYSKDIPDLRKALGQAGKELRAALVKGRSNYLCLRRWELFRQRSGRSAQEALFTVKVLLWLQSTTAGDAAELPLNAEERQLWLQVCATPETCTGRRCRGARGGPCYLTRARLRAEAAHLVVVNHSLLLSDIAANNTVLPEYGRVVIDEAHKLESQATDQFSFAADPRTIGELLDRVSRPVPGADREEGLAGVLPATLRTSRASTDTVNKVLTLSRDLAAAAAGARARVDEFFSSLGPVLKYGGPQREHDLQLRIVESVRRAPEWSRVRGAWEKLELRLGELRERVTAAVEVYEALEGLNVADFEEILGELQSIQQLSSSLLENLTRVIVQPSDNDVVWVRRQARSGTLSLHRAPLNVGSLLRDRLFDQNDTVVLTSATLAVDGAFEFVCSRLGLDAPQTLLVGSPYDYAASTLMLLPQDMPEPASQGYQKAVEQAVERMAVAAGGRTLALFTSHSAVQATARALRGSLARQDILVLAHGDAPRHRLLQQFRANPRTVLLGTRSFWEGVDIIGEALSLLIVAKLPFEVPTDPVFAARSEQFDDAFSEFGLPQAVIRLKQGFGRLIRSSQDRGVVAILDRRLISRSYGSTFLRSLPECETRRLPLDEMARLTAEWLEARDGVPSDPLPSNPVLREL